MDILYFYHILLLKKNKVSTLGHTFHNQKVFDAFSLLINDNKKNQNHELFTFIAGLITHYQADSIMHPYINYIAKEINTKIKTNGHFEIETYLDNYFIKKKSLVEPKKYNNTKFIFNYTKEKIICDELDKLFQDLFNYNNLGKKYYQALKDMKFVYNYIRYDKHGIKKRIYQLIDLNPIRSLPRVTYLSYYFDTNNDDFYLNLKNHKWFNLDNPKLQSTKSFLDLYQDVTNESSKIINELYEYIFHDKKIDLKKLIKNKSYANGLNLSPNK